MLEASNIRYDVADRVGAIGMGGIGMIHQLTRRTGLIDAIDRDVRVLKTRFPYHESDHVLNVADNVMAGGTCLEDIELRRRDKHYLNALGAKTIPDPTYSGGDKRLLQTLYPRWASGRVDGDDQRHTPERMPPAIPGVLHRGGTRQRRGMPRRLTFSCLTHHLHITARR